MIRSVLAVIAGFVAWTILWLGSDQVLRSMSPDWYGAHQFGLERAIFNTEPFAVDSSILMISLGRSISFSIMAGFLSAFIAGENRKSPLWLGILLLVFGLFFQVSVWNYLPIWYHLLFLALLVPMAVLGGKLKKFPV
jgi:hypothetical protein